MRRLLDMADWPWTDHGPKLSRYGLFLRSGELLTTVFLIFSAYALVVPGSSFARASAFLWITEVAGGNTSTWAILAVALSITGPLALVLDRGTLRVLSVISQGVYFLTFGFSFRLHSPTGIAWTLFLTCGSWLMLRAAVLIRHHWRRGGDHDHRQSS